MGTTPLPRSVASSPLTQVLSGVPSRPRLKIKGNSKDDFEGLKQDHSCSFEQKFTIKAIQLETKPKFRNTNKENWIHRLFLFGPLKTEQLG